MSLFFFLALLLIILNPTHSETLNCDGNCSCTAPEPCIINCIGSNACKGSNVQIACKYGYPCTILCNGRTSCQDIQIMDNGATDTTLFCTGGARSCSGDTIFNCGHGFCAVTCDNAETNSCSNLQINTNNANGFHCDGNCPPTSHPFAAPTISPSPSPTINPTPSPTINPTPSTSNPTKYPTNDPTNNPSKYPTSNPTKQPTVNPTKHPTLSATNNSMTATPLTAAPTKSPFNTAMPTSAVSNNPTLFPTTYRMRETTKNQTTDDVIKYTVNETKYGSTVHPNVIKEKRGIIMLLGTEWELSLFVVTLTVSCLCIICCFFILFVNMGPFQSKHNGNTKDMVVTSIDTEMTANNDSDGSDDMDEEQIKMKSEASPNTDNENNNMLDFVNIYLKRLEPNGVHKTKMVKPSSPKQQQLQTMIDNKAKEIECIHKIIDDIEEMEESDSMYLGDIDSLATY